MPPKTSPGDADAAKKRNITTAMEAAAGRAPPTVGNVIKILIPYVILLVDLIDKSGPYFAQAYALGLKVWEALQPYHPEQLAPILTGLVLCCFGGSYVTLIAAVEAFRLTGYQRMSAALGIIYQSALTALEASRKDDAVDADGDGVADVLQISQQQLLTRKLQVVFKAVDPDRFSDALTAVWSGSLAVIATLRVQFAQAVTLGASIGDMAYKYVGTTVEPVLRNVIPPEGHRWVPTLVTYACKAFGVSIAWFLQRVISAFYSATRGGQMFATNLQLYLKTNRNIDLPPNAVHGIALFMTGAGFLWQLNHGFSVPFPLNFFLLPVTIVEYLLMWIVGVN
jgi:hypothetical protein